MKTSVELEAADKEEALNKGKKLLEKDYSQEIDKDFLEVKLLEKGKKILGLFGNKKNKYKVKSKDDNKIQKQLQEITDEINLDGDFKFRVHSEGIFIKIFAPEGDGKKVSFQEVKQFLEEKEIEEIDQEKLQEAVREAENKWVKIAPRKTELDQDAELEVNIASDGLRAYLDYSPALGGKKLTIVDLKKKLEEEGIVFGIKEEKIEQLIENRVKHKELLIAEGEEPEPPEDEELVYHFEDVKESIGTQREDGSMNYYDRGLITNVEPGDVLVTIKEAEEGLPGHKVTGEEIPPPEPKKAELPSGKNVKTEDEKTLVSEIEGQVVKEGKRVNVLPIHEVNGNVDINTGNIEFVGNVLVKGDVEEGFKIKAGGNVEVRGHVSAAKIESSGEIVINKGFIGKEKGRLEAEGNVKVKFIENGFVKSEKSIIVSDAVMHSRLNAGDDIVVTENKGLLVGGESQAGHHIKANIVGSSMATKTKLEAGVNQKTKEKINEIEEELEEADQNLLKTKRAISTLDKMRKKMGKLPQDKEIMYQRLQKTRKKIESSINNKKSEKEELEKTLKNVERGKIKINERVFSGTKLIIGSSQYNVHNELQHSSFIEENGEVRQIPL